MMLYTVILHLQCNDLHKTFKLSVGVGFSFDRELVGLENAPLKFEKTVSRLPTSRRLTTRLLVNERSIQPPWRKKVHQWTASA